MLYDIHANLPALDAVLADARSKGVTTFFLGGDLVGFGPFQRETLSALREIDEPTMCIRGNGERWMREPPLDRPEILGNLKEHVARFAEEEVEWLYRLPERAEVDGVVYVHGCYWSDVDSNTGPCKNFDRVKVTLPDNFSSAKVASTGCLNPSSVRVGPVSATPPS